MWHPKTQKTDPKSTQNQKSSRTQICFLCVFKVKKTSNINFIHHIETFDTIINHYGGQNLHQ